MLPTTPGLWSIAAPCCRGLWKCVSPFIEPETLKKVQWVYASDPAELRRNFDVEVSVLASCQPCRCHCSYSAQPPYLCWHAIGPSLLHKCEWECCAVLQLLPEAFGGSAKPAPAQTAEGSYATTNGRRAEAVSA